MLLKVFLLIYRHRHRGNRLNHADRKCNYSLKINTFFSALNIIDGIG